MPIQSIELVFCKPDTITDTGANGGRMVAAQAANGVKNSVFPDVAQAQRQAGLTRWRKLFAKVANADNLALQNARLHLAKPTDSDDRVTLAAGTQRDRQADLTSPREYGSARLKTDVAAGAASFVVLLEDASQSIFASADTIWIGDATNNEYFAAVTVAKVGAEVTITLSGADQLAHAYQAANAYAASCLTLGEVKGTVANWVETSAAGAYDETGHPLELDNIGTIEDDWLLTFTSPTGFSVAGTYTGALASGTIIQDHAPANPAQSKPYFTLRAAGFSGAWTSGDTLRFSTHPAAAPLWLKQQVPAGAAAANAATFEIVIAGESS